MPTTQHTRATIDRETEAFLVTWMTTGSRLQSVLSTTPLQSKTLTSGAPRLPAVYQNVRLAQARLEEIARLAGLQPDRLVREVVSSAASIQRLDASVALQRDMAWVRIPLAFRSRKQIAGKLTSALFDLIPWLLLLPAPALTHLAEQLSPGRRVLSWTVQPEWLSWETLASSLPSDALDEVAQPWHAVLLQARSARNELVMRHRKCAFRTLRVRCTSTRKQRRDDRADLLQEACVLLIEICDEYARLCPSPEIGFRPYLLDRLRQWRSPETFEPAFDASDLPEAEPVEKLVDRAALRETLDECIMMVPECEARMLQVRFGLWDGHEHTLDETGRIVLGPDSRPSRKETARQAIHNALCRLRHPTHSRRLARFWAAT